MPTVDPASCPECGARSVEGREGCRELFEEVVGREFSQPALFAVHQQTVSAYSLQHPDAYLKSAKSTAAHLAGLCWALEFGGGPSVSRALSTWLDGTPEIARIAPPPPGRRGRRTVEHVHRRRDAAGHREAVGEWASSVWDAWSDHPERARTWVREAKAKTRGLHDR